MTKEQQELLVAIARALEGLCAGQGLKWDRDNLANALHPFRLEEYNKGKP